VARTLPAPRPGPRSSTTTRILGLIGARVNSSSEAIHGQVSETSNRWTRPLVGARVTYESAQGASSWIGEMSALVGFDAPFEGSSFPISYDLSATVLPSAAKGTRIRFGASLDGRNLAQPTPDLTESSPATAPKRIRTANVLAAEALMRARFRLFGLASEGDLRFGPAISDTPSADADAASFSGGLSGVRFDAAVRTKGISVGGFSLSLEAEFQSYRLWGASSRWTETAESLLFVVPF